MGGEFQEFVSITNSDNKEIVHLGHVVSASPKPGVTNTASVVLKDEEGRERVRLGASSANILAGGNGADGHVLLKNKNGEVSVKILSANAAMYLGARNNEGDLIVLDNAATQRIVLNGSNGQIVLRRSSGEESVEVNGGQGTIMLRGAGGSIEVLGAIGRIVLRGGDGMERIVMDGLLGDIKLTNADFAENFKVHESEIVEPGDVVVLDDGGAVSRTDRGYDTRVAGVVAGAGGQGPGIVLNHHSGTGGLPVAIAGRVCCKVDARHEAIRVGDLLTTSEMAGYAMKVSEPSRAFGAVVGKALASHGLGIGMVPVLIALQ